MTRKFSILRSVLRGLVLLGALLAVGCEAPGVGDPCEPEQIPMGGFVNTEAYLETSSVQCRTRVCMVYQLAGLPAREAGDCDPGTQNCASIQETIDRVYCTCRCDAPSGSTATLCDCPDDFTCREVVVLEGAGDGIRGSYCVRNGTFDPEES